MIDFIVLISHIFQCTINAKSQLGYFILFLAWINNHKILLRKIVLSNLNNLSLKNDLIEVIKLIINKYIEFAKSKISRYFEIKFRVFGKCYHLISKIKSSIYTRYEINDHSYFHCIWLLLIYSENLVGQLQYFWAIDGLHYVMHQYLIFLAIISLDWDEKVLIRAWTLVFQKDHKNWLWFLKKIALHLNFMII